LLGHCCCHQRIECCEYNAQGGEQCAGEDRGSSGSDQQIVNSLEKIFYLWDLFKYLQDYLSSQFLYLVL
jgi:hypothetical protein